MVPVPPQQRRYLRNAPRPEAWAGLRDTVLDQLMLSVRASNQQQGDNNISTAMEAVLQETLRQLQVCHPLPPRAGPGRKSNAEHAVNFYEYLLAELPRYLEEREQRGTSDDTNPAAAAPEESEEENNDNDENNDGEAGDDDDDNEQDQEESLLDDDDDGGQSMDTEAFAAEHNDLCEVCDGAGDVILCSTCNLVFHLGCVRPVVEGEMPEPGDTNHNWVCAYCVMAQGLPVASKPRRQAAAAVRLMARLRKRKVREREEREAAAAAAAAAGGTKRVEGEDEEAKQVEEDFDDDDDDDDRKPAAKPSQALKRSAAASEDEAPENETTKQEEDLSSDKGAAAPKEDEPPADEAEDEKTESAAEATQPSSSVAGKPSSAGDEKIGIPETNKPTSVTEEDRDEDASKKKDSEASDDAASADPTSDTVEKGTESSSKAAGRKSPRRSKHPTLYNPQAGAASKWQTDELQEWKISHDEEATAVKAEEGGEGDESTAISARRAARNDEGTIWCSFCKDKPEIQVCVFCACRVCFGKHQGKKLLICDQCDEEYHTFCLDPPLDAIPNSNKWFCPNCSQQTAKKTDSSRSRRTTTTARPPASRNNSRSDSKTPTPKRSKRVSSLEKKKASDEKKKSKRPRGRPPKNAPEAATAPRKRGRPPKNPQSAESDRPRKRGRPPKSDQSKKRSKSEPPRKRGRPPSAKTLAKRAKAEAARAAASAPATSPSKRSGEHMSETAVRMALAAAAAAAAKPTMPATKSRSGRVVKRSTFYDDFGQGMQQLQTSRLLEHLQTTGGTASGVDIGNLQLPGGIAGSADASAALASAARGYASSTGSGSASASLKAPPGQAQLKQAPAGTAVPAGATLNMANFPGLAGSASAANANMLQSMNVASVVNPAASAAAAYLRAGDSAKQPRRKPGARECMQISRRFGVKEIPQEYIEILTDYCHRGKVEHLIRMRERLDEHSRFLEAQLAGLESLVKEKGESDVVVPLAPPSPGRND